MKNQMNQKKGIQKWKSGIASGIVVLAMTSGCSLFSPWIGDWVYKGLDTVGITYGVDGCANFIGAFMKTTKHVTDTLMEDTSVNYSDSGCKTKISTVFASYTYKTGASSSAKSAMLDFTTGATNLKDTGDSATEVDMTLSKVTFTCNASGCAQPYADCASKTFPIGTEVDITACAKTSQPTISERYDIFTINGEGKHLEFGSSYDGTAYNLDGSTKAKRPKYLDGSGAYWLKLK
ncbi:MAG: hypothetical protein OEV66_02865 [Spirochaetia bacterium]|nr:hypothetical protein [Spirochaetia bacterium]